MNPGEERLLGELRPIFPQFNDIVLLNCIRAVRNPDAPNNNPMAILPQCIDLLLFGAEEELGNPFALPVERNPLGDIVFVGDERAGNQNRQNVAAVNDDLPVSRKPEYHRFNNNNAVDVDINPFGDWNEPSNEWIDLASSDESENEANSFSDREQVVSTDHNVITPPSLKLPQYTPFKDPKPIPNAAPRLDLQPTKPVPPPKPSLAPRPVVSPAKLIVPPPMPKTATVIRPAVSEPTLPVDPPNPNATPRLVETPIKPVPPPKPNATPRPVATPPKPVPPPRPNATPRLVATPIKPVPPPRPNTTPRPVTTPPKPVDPPKANAAPTAAAIPQRPGAAPSHSVNQRQDTTSNNHTQTNAPTLSPIDNLKNEILVLFPDIDNNYLHTLVNNNLLNNSHNDTLIIVCNFLLENKDYPKLVKTPTTANTSKSSEPVETDTKNYFQDYSHRVSYQYEQQASILLQNEFRRISVRDIRKALAHFGGHYAPTHRCLEESMKASRSHSTNTVVQNQQLSTTSASLLQLSSPNSPCTLPSPFIINLVLLKSPNGRCVTYIKSICDELQKEVDFVKRMKRLQTEETDRLIAASVNEKEYEDQGQMIECGCCYGEASFENMVQCLDGHLFCKDCLFRYAKEAVYGSGKLLLMCMSDGCDSSYPKSQLTKALPENLFVKYEERLQEESICLAEMEDLVHCPHCDFAAIMPPGDKVFKCMNEKCMKESCRYCKEDWADHFGIPCKELEKRSHTNLRLSYEEKMTMAKVRTCVRCKSSFTKESGCNKMTCRCGQTMCYICRKSSINYGHFCQHPRDPGHKCKTCTACSLWSNPDEDDEMAIKQLEKEVETEKRKLDESSEPLTSTVNSANHDIYPQPKRARTTV